MRRRAILDSALAAVCGIVAFVLCDVTGRIGFMPLDQSLIFDGGWRVLNGQVPWRDFMIPNGLTPIALQAVAFAVGGVSWSSYVAHAAGVNAAGAVGVYIFLRHAGLWHVPAFACGLATGVWLYAPVGTPYMDQHSLLFGVASVLICLRVAGTGRYLWWVTAGGCAAFALLAKQVPAGLMLPLAAAAWIRRPGWVTVRGLAVTTGTALVCLGFVALLLLSLGSSLTDIVEFGWSVPLEVGSSRRAGFGAMLAPNLLALRRAMFLSQWLVVGALAMLLVMQITARDRYWPAPWGWIAMGLLLIATTATFTTLTLNAPEQAYGALPLASGLLLLGLQTALTARGNSPKVRRLAAIVVGLGTLLVGGDAVRGFQRVALSRYVNDLTIDVNGWAEARPGPRLAASGFRVWRVPKEAPATETFEELLAFVEKHEGNVFLLGDESILYGLTGRPSISPLLWFHPGLTFRQVDAVHERLENWFKRNLQEHHVRWVLIPDHPSWLRLDENTSPWLAARLRAATCQRVGRYRACDISNTDSAGG